MSVKDRIKEYCSYKKITVKEFEISIKASNGYVNSISKGIGEDKLTLIIENYPNINIGWLLTGKGSMLKDEHQADTVSKVAEEKGKMDGDAPKKETRCLLCEEKEKRIEELKDQISTLKDHVNVLQNLIKAK